MFWAEAVPAGLFMILLFFIPESPRWLARVNRDERAQEILGRIGGMDFAREVGNDIALSLKDGIPGVSLRPLFKRDVRRVVLLGLGLAIFQQWCGINVVFNYAEEVFSAAGYEVSAILLNIVITGVVNLVFTLLAIRVVDRWGRRRLMLIGAFGLGILYLVLGLFYFLDINGTGILVIVLLCIAVYGLTLAPVTWVVLSEIFPNRLRGVAMAAAATTLWVASSIIVLSFPFLNRALDAHGTFWLYAGICIVGFVFIYRHLPETRRKSLEAIEKELKGK
jgi:SP family sugar porter-like MFS transporter